MSLPFSFIIRFHIDFDVGFIDLSVLKIDLLIVNH